MPPQPASSASTAVLIEACMKLLYPSELGGRPASEVLPLIPVHEHLRARFRPLVYLVQRALNPDFTPGDTNIEDGELLFWARRMLFHAGHLVHALSMPYTFGTPLYPGTPFGPENTEVPSEIARGLRLFLVMSSDLGLKSAESGPFAATVERHLKSARLLLYLSEETGRRNGTPAEYPTYDESGRYVGTGTETL